MNELTPYSSENSQLPEELPPVEAPTAGFLIQLFVIPAIIVFAVVLVYVLFGKIASGEADPAQFRAALRSTNPVRRWQAAHSLAQTLEADEQLSKNKELAADLAELLDSELNDGPGANDDERTLRAYLVTALGRFHTPVGVPVLQRAMKPPHAVRVRIRAILALLDLKERVEDFKDPELVSDLIESSADVEPILRKVSAYAMGMLREPRFEARLQEMLADGDIDVRYNAALALARNGNAASMSVLVAMLDPENKAGVSSESPERQDYKSSAIVQNALAGAESLVTNNRQVDLSALRGPLKTLSEHPSPAVYLRATNLLRKLEQREGK